MAATASTRSTSRRHPVLRGLWWTLRTLVLTVVGYFVLCTLLLVLFRFVNPPFTTVHVQRWVGSWVHDDAYDWRYDPVARDQMALAFRRAVVAAEDTRFYQHNGFDWVEIENARRDYERSGEMRGASTISMQLARNLFLTTHRSPIRKAFEIPLTLLVELILPKERIIDLYCNVVELGPHGVFGVEAAAQYHYGIAAARLTRSQSARLAAILPDPQDRRPQAMDRYSRTIQQRMWQLGY